LRNRFGNIISGSLFGRKRGNGRRSGDGRWRRGLTDRRLKYLGSGGRCSLSGYNLRLGGVTYIVIGLNGFFLQETEDVVEHKVTVGLLSKEKSLYKLPPSLPAI